MKIPDIKCCNKRMVNKCSDFSQKKETWQLELLCSVCRWKYFIAVSSPDDGFGINFVDREIDVEESTRHLLE